MPACSIEMDPTYFQILAEGNRSVELVVYRVRVDGCRYVVALADERLIVYD